MQRIASILALASTLAPTPAHALVWPDVAERVEQDLQASDPATRRTAAQELVQLGAGRGAPLAIDALSDVNDEVRLAAAEAAIRLRAAAATNVVTSWLNAPDARLRRKACEVARALPSAQAVGPLSRTLGDPDAEVRAAAADALGHQASPEAVAPLLGRLDDPAPPVRIQIVGALARLGDRRAVVPLVGKVQDSSPDVREAVAHALGDLGDPRASSALVLALRDQNNDVRRDALAALGRMRAADAVDAISPFVTDRTPSLRLAALGALGRIASADAVRVVVQSLGTGDDAGGALERTAARDALVAAGPAAIAELHVVLSSSSSLQSTTSAAWVLGELKATREASAIVAAMRRGALPAAAALHALAGAGTAAEVPVVLEFAADPSPAVRAEALGAAMALLDPAHPDGRAVEPLAAALRNERPSTRERARIAALLGRTGAPRAAPLLVELVRAHDPELRLAAIDALGTLASEAPGTPGSAEADKALLDGLASPDPAERLHAAIALSQAGGAAARDALLEKLDGGDEVDRAAVLTALGGVLSRVPTEASTHELEAALEVAAGPERDALIDALGREPLAAAMRSLATVARREEPLDRVAVAEVLAAHAGDPTARRVALGLLDDPVPTVRAAAAWTLGTLGEASDVPHLTAMAAAQDADAAVDAAAAIGRISARAGDTAGAARALCRIVRDPRPYVRANALAGLALASARCGDGAAERTALADDPSEDVRAAAALLVSRAPTADDTRALERCSRADPSGTVAARCSRQGAAPTRARATLVYVVSEAGAVPRASASFAMQLADGTIHVGTTDRRGAVFDPAAPAGEITLRRPSALVR